MSIQILHRPAAHSPTFRLNRHLSMCKIKLIKAEQKYSWESINYDSLEVNDDGNKENTCGEERESGMY
jgi:hypothetical protein